MIEIWGVESVQASVLHVPIMTASHITSGQEGGDGLHDRGERHSMESLVPVMRSWALYLSRIHQISLMEITQW